MDTTSRLSLMEICFASVEDSAFIPSVSDAGIRLVCDSLTMADTVKICERYAQGYRLRPDRRIAPEVVADNPSIVLDYQPQYEMADFERPSDGSRLFTVSRTVYLGGSNFFTHILASFEPIAATVFAALQREWLWRPSDPMPTAANASLTDLLVGSIRQTPPLQLTLPDSLPLSSLASAPEMASILSAMLRTRLNRLLGKAPTLGQLVVIADSQRTEQLVGLLGALPPALTADLSMVTNYLPDPATPIDEEIDIVFVNELAGELPDLSAYVTLDLSAEGLRSANLPSTAIDERIVRLIADRDFVTLGSLLSWYLALPAVEAADCDDACELFLATETSLPLEIGLTDVDFVRRMGALESVAGRDCVFDKLCDLVGLTIAESSKSLQLINALALASAASDAFARPMPLGQKATDRLARLLFLRGSNAYLGRMVTEANIATIMQLLAPEQMGDEETFFAALGQSRSVDVWEQLIRHYFRGVPHTSLAEVMRAVAGSALGADERSELAERLFPAADFATMLVDFYHAEPLMIGEIPGPVTTICLGSRDECFSRLIDPATPESVLALVKPLVAAYYGPRMADNPDLALASLLRMARRMGAELFDRLELGALIDAYLDDACRRPGATTAAATNAVVLTGIRLTDRQAGRFDALRAVSTGGVPPSVTTEVMLMAACLGDEALNYRTSLFELWLTTAPSVETLVNYLDEAAITDPNLIENMIMSIWRAPSRRIRADRSDYIRSLLRAAPLPKDDLQAFAHDCGDPDLEQVLLNRSWLSRLFTRRSRGK